MSAPAACTQVLRAEAAQLARVLLRHVVAFLSESEEAFARLRGLAPERLATEAVGLADLERRGTTCTDVGWCLGVLAGGAGSALLGERRDVDGLRRTAELLTRALDRPLEPSAAALPRLAPGAGAGWELPFVLAALLVRADRALPPGRPLVWSLRRGPVVGEERLAVPGLCPAPELDALLAVLPGAGFEDSPAGPVLRIPPGWLEPERREHEAPRRPGPAR